MDLASLLCPQSPAQGLGGRMAADAYCMNERREACLARVNGGADESAAQEREVTRTRHPAADYTLSCQSHQGQK